MKTKVIAFRVTQDEYDALCAQAEGSRKVSELVYDCVNGAIDAGRAKIVKERKRQEAKAKREAKKAAANGAQ